jgi:GNAT superfamily N-acetyltransferase
LQISIRPASIADHALIAPLFAAFLGREYPASAEESQSLRIVLESAVHIVLIAENGRAAVGLITASVRRVARYATPIAEIDELFVSPGARSLGAARALVTSLEQVAMELGCARIFVASNNNRPAAHEFYEHIGYQLYGAHFRNDLL